MRRYLHRSNRSNPLKNHSRYRSRPPAISVSSRSVKNRPKVPCPTRKPTRRLRPNLNRAGLSLKFSPPPDFSVDTRSHLRPNQRMRKRPEKPGRYPSRSKRASTRSLSKQRRRTMRPNRPVSPNLRAARRSASGPPMRIYLPNRRRGWSSSRLQPDKTQSPKNSTKRRWKKSPQTESKRPSMRLPRRLPKSPSRRTQTSKRRSKNCPNRSKSPKRPPRMPSSSLLSPNWPTRPSTLPRTQVAVRQTEVSQSIPTTPLRSTENSRAWPRRSRLPRSRRSMRPPSRSRRSPKRISPSRRERPPMTTRPRPPVRSNLPASRRRPPPSGASSSSPMSHPSPTLRSSASPSEGTAIRNLHRN